jgi:hypothetical protein
LDGLLLFIALFVDFNWCTIIKALPKCKMASNPQPAAVGKVALPAMVKGYECDTHKIALTQAVDLLANVGLLPELVKASLLVTGDVVASFNILSEKVVDVCSRDQFGTAASLWKAPIAVRIGKIPDAYI